MKADIANLRDAIRRLHGCEAVHLMSSPVNEQFQGRTVWDGKVEVFDLIGHPKAKRCYAWAHKQDDGSDRYVAVLEIPPVDSPITAVRAAIVAESKSRKA